MNEDYEVVWNGSHRGAGLDLLSATPEPPPTVLPKYEHRAYVTRKKSGGSARLGVGLARKLADLTDFIRPDLNVVDAFRVLLRHGPTGGNLADVSEPKTVIVATDAVLADAFAAKLLNKDPMSLSYIEEAVRRNYGSADIDKADILNVSA